MIELLLLSVEAIVPKMLELSVIQGDDPDMNLILTDPSQRRFQGTYWQNKTVHHKRCELLERKSKYI